MDSPFPYIGGKSRLAKQIIDMMPKHDAYCEVFAGAAWVLFKKEPEKIERINDLDGELIAFYLVLQNHLEEFCKQFKWLLSSRKVFNDWARQQEAGGLTDIQRAARLYYLQRQCFGGKVGGKQYFGTSVTRGPRINLIRMEEDLSVLHLRLTNVVIEHLPYSKFITTYDRPSTLFYMDPPYYKLPYYNYNLEHEDYIEMADILSNLKGKFILSINDCPEMREIFKAFNIQEVTLTYSAAGGHRPRKKATELLITNY